MKKKMKKKTKAKKPAVKAVKAKKKQRGKVIGKPFEKGKSGNPKGRPKGAVSAKTLIVEEKLAAVGCDPIEEMAKLAMDKKVAESVRAKLLSELANYVYPKRKAVEMDVPEESAQTVQEFLDSLKEVPR